MSRSVYLIPTILVALLKIAVVAASSEQSDGDVCDARPGKSESRVSLIQLMNLQSATYERQVRKQVRGERNSEDEGEAEGQAEGEDQGEEKAVAAAKAVYAAEAKAKAEGDAIAEGTFAAEFEAEGKAEDEAEAKDEAKPEAKAEAKREGEGKHGLTWNTAEHLVGPESQAKPQMNKNAHPPGSGHDCPPPSPAAWMSSQPAMLGVPEELPGLSFLHEIVGWDGVLQISLKRTPQRANFASSHLREVGISARSFPATDSACTPQNILDEGCNQNCGPEERAIAHSHKRALEVAALRNHTWTAILEDDAVPVLTNGMTGKMWNDEFHNVWAKLPSNARIVRMNWCWPGDWNIQWTTDKIGDGKMKFTQFAMKHPSQNIFHSVGLCTSAYIVHKDVVAKLLSIFPCNCALDACMSWKFFNSWDTAADVPVPMLSYLYNLDVDGSQRFIQATSYEDRPMSGVMMQAYKQLQKLAELGSTVSIRAGTL